MKLIGKVLLFNIPFFLVSGWLFYMGYTAGENELTDDGYDLKSIFYLMSASFIAITLSISFGKVIWTKVKQKRIEDLLLTGKQGTAVILEMTDTGVRIDDNPRIRLLLEISVPDYQPYRAKKTIALPIIVLPQVQPGLTIDILADPEQPDNEKSIALMLK